MALRAGLSSKGRAGKGAAPEEAQTMKKVKEWSTWAVKKAKVAVHFGFIPMIIIIGMNTEPKPQLYQLLAPV